MSRPLLAIGLVLAGCSHQNAEVIGQFDRDDDGVPSQHDCDDQDPDRGEATLWYVDADGDDYGAAYDAVLGCDNPGDRVSRGGDCDDENADIFPSASERCNGIDDDCDGEIDEGDPDGAGVVWYQDHDGDGFGGPIAAGVDCVEAQGWVADNSDCDDADPAVHPAADELCADARDNNCDGLVDDGSSLDATAWFLDADQDGFGDPDTSLRSCEALAGYLTTAEDCDDEAPTTHPLAPEICDGADNNCDGAVDDDDPWLVGAPAWYEDADSDGFGTGVVRQISCAAFPGYAPNNQDCADADATINPSATERCDGLDNDCDGLTDAYDVDLDLTTAPVWYPDGDGDGHGAPGPAVRACSQPVKHVLSSGDCNDAHADSWPGAPELCDARDNDCDLLVDEDVPTRWFPDLDQDGFGDIDGEAIAQCDPIDGYSTLGLDCDDGDAEVHPAAEERCDGRDNNCNSFIDDADDALVATVWFEDADEDGHGAPLKQVTACAQPDGYVAVATDCDDTRPSIFAGAPERCDDLDNDCDGQFDDQDPDLRDAPAAYRDTDRDGFGDPNSETALCTLLPGFVRTAADCNDSLPAVNPAAVEICNSSDDDCDGLVDDDDPNVDPAGFLPLYLDADGDGFGDIGTDPACAAGSGSAFAAGDCDDTDATSHPDAIELCDGLDNNCNGLVDDGTPATWYLDQDGDGHGDPAHGQDACFPPLGYVGNSSDCDDLQVAVHPDAPELCNGQDDDCDLQVDDADPDVQGTVWYADADADGFGSDASQLIACAAPAGYVEASGDCQDAHSQIHPDAAEVCGGIDEDCDGLVDDADPDREGGTVWHPDADADGFGASAGVSACIQPAGTLADASDCNDADFKINPDAAELCGGADEDCNGLVDDEDPGVTDPRSWFADRDSDGFGDLLAQSIACLAPGNAVADSSDCDDDQSGIHPAAAEIPGNGVDEDCNGVLACFADVDQDGFGSPQTVADDGDGVCKAAEGEADDPSDCDDGAPDVHPDAQEICGGGDEDCNGLVDNEDPGLTGVPAYYPDADADGFGDSAGLAEICSSAGNVDNSLDCNDQDAAVNPGALETPGNPVDEDCDGAVACYEDLDGDGYGSKLVVADDGNGVCLTAEGEATNFADCADSAPSIHPGAVERCGGGDDNCDGLVDEEDPDVVGMIDTYKDADGDGSGNPNTLVRACTIAQGSVANPRDCNDLDDSLFHGSACDDGDSCTLNDGCMEGVCTGIIEPSAQCGCTDSCDMVAPGGCCGGACDGQTCVDCPPDASCHQECKSASGCGAVRCESGSICTLDVRAISGDPPAADLECRDATCAMSCSAFEGGCEMRCRDSAVCDLSCDAGDSCFLHCEDDSACALTCNSMGGCFLSCAAPTSCPDGSQVCGQPCLP